MFQGKIYREVIKVIKAKIREVQRLYKQSLKEMEERHEQEKADLLASHVSAVIEKII